MNRREFLKATLVATVFTGCVTPIPVPPADVAWKTENGQEWLTETGQPWFVEPPVVKAAKH